MDHHHLDMEYDDENNKNNDDGNEKDYDYHHHLVRSPSSRQKCQSNRPC